MGRNFAQAVALGFTLVVILIIIGGLGLLADTFLGTLPLFLLLGLIAGFALGLYYTYVTLKNMGDG